MNLSNRRCLLTLAGALAAGMVSLEEAEERPEVYKQPVAIKDLWIKQGVTIEADDGTKGSFRGSSAQNIKILQKHLA